MVAEKQRQHEMNHGQRLLVGQQERMGSKSFGAGLMDVSQLPISLLSAPLLCLSLTVILILSGNLSGLSTCLRLQYVFAVALAVLTNNDLCYISWTFCSSLLLSLFPSLATGSCLAGRWPGMSHSWVCEQVAV